MMEREVTLVALKEGDRRGPGGGDCWATVKWDDGDYGYHYAHMEVTEEEAMDLGPHLFKKFKLTLSLSDD